MVATSMLLNAQSALTSRSVASRKPFSSGRHAQKAAQIVRAGDPASPDSGEVSGDVLDYAKSLPGISQPFPNIFDPADFLGNARTVDDVRRWRESEVTHGRVAMLASLGFIAQEQLIDWPQSPFPHVEGAAITHFQQVESKGAIFWEPLVFAIGLAEAYRISVGWANPKGTGFNRLDPDYVPGDLGFDPLNLYPSDPKQQYDLKTKELNNGRLAMIAIAAFVAQELRVQKPIFENAQTAVGAA